jgi:uncharacterized protein
MGASGGESQSNRLGGSYARGTARADSDLDLVVLTNAPEFFRADASWLDAIG